MADRAVYPCNEAYRNEITIRVITDGEHTVLDRLEPEYRECFEEVVTSPETGLMLGFEAQDYLASQLQEGYDLYGYLEDDLVIRTELDGGVGKYGRLLGWLYIGDAELSLNELMIEEGYAWEYDGGTKQKNFEELREIRRAKGTLVE